MRNQKYFSTVTFMYNDNVSKIFTANSAKEDLKVEIKAMQKTSGWHSKFTLSFYDFLDNFFPDNDVTYSNSTNPQM